MQDEECRSEINFLGRELPSAELAETVEQVAGITPKSRLRRARPPRRRPWPCTRVFAAMLPPVTSQGLYSLYSAMPSQGKGARPGRRRDTIEPCCALDPGSSCW